jgi:hypothetical protein
MRLSDLCDTFNEFTFVYFLVVYAKNMIILF